MSKKQSLGKLEVFFLLGLRQAEKSRSTDNLNEPENENAAQQLTASENFSAFFDQLSKSEAEKFDRLRLAYEKKSEIEKQKWREQIESSIGRDEFLLDEHIHRSRVKAALDKEILPIRRIIAASLPTIYKNDLKSELSEIENQTNKVESVAAVNLKKTVRQTFASQFVSIKNLPDAKTFDGLSGARLARLARLAGIREVAYACAGIKAVEAIGAFLRRFAPEDARAIAAQLSNLPKISDERLEFAETLVQDALEIEPQPAAAMLDWLGIRLVGILLCERESAVRIAYTEQKLPLETAPTLSEIIETQCRRTPDALKRQISAEIEKLAETIAESGGKI